MTKFFIFYMIGWSSASLAALYLMIRHRASIDLLHLGYWRFLLQKWKVITFVIAAVALTAIAPYAGDPTWDYIDASFMSIKLLMEDREYVAIPSLSGRCFLLLE